MYLQKSISRITDFSLTLLLWSYYLCSSIVLFFFCYLPAYFFSANRAAAIQKYTHIQMKIFFKLTQWLIPRTRFTIQDEVRRLRSSVIVCNHLSYLDPILLISLLPQQRTIVKNTFFKIPFFGWFMRNAGYVPSAPSEMLGEAMVKNLESIKKHLEAGGNLFVFPEGTRSRDGKLAPFNKGVFSIAHYCNAPLALIFIEGTDKLFRPGSFSFNTRDFNEIKVELMDFLDPDYQSREFSTTVLANYVRKLYAKRAKQSG